MARAFASFGSVVAVNLPREERMPQGPGASGPSRNDGFVVMASPDDAKRCLMHLNGSTLLDGTMPLRVTWAPETYSPTSVEAECPNTDSGNLSRSYKSSHLHRSWTPHVRSPAVVYARFESDIVSSSSIRRQTVSLLCDMYAVLWSSCGASFVWLMAHICISFDIQDPSMMENRLYQIFSAYASVEEVCIQNIFTDGVWMHVCAAVAFVFLA
jgi:hypothetical protein